MPIIAQIRKMAAMTSVIRVLRAICLSALAVLLVLFAFIQIQQHLLRHRAERLLADFQTIRLHQSTWADAQALTTRWGAWGHYDGQCTASDCAYTVTLSDPVSRISRHMKSNAGWRLVMYLARAYIFLGGKIATFRVTFLVQDASIWRSGVWLNLQVPPHAKKDADYDGDYSLLLSARASDSLHETRHGPWILGADDQLADHPNYKEGRPSGCESCESSEVTFTPYISTAELRQVTSYDLSCLTRFHSCLDPPDVLPIARVWDAYPPPQPKAPAEQCGIPISARARDANDVLVVDMLSSKIVKRPAAEHPPGNDVQIANVRVVQPLKGTIASGELLDAVSIASHNRYVDSYFERAPENLQVGKRYVIFPDSTSHASQIGLDFCSVVDDTPAAREEVQQGIAQNDALRRTEEFGGKFW